MPVGDVRSWLDETSWECEPAVSASMLETVSRSVAEAGVSRDAALARDLIDTADRLRGTRVQYRVNTATWG